MNEEAYEVLEAATSLAIPNEYLYASVQRRPEYST